MKVIEQAIICLVLLLMAYAVCGCEEEPVIGKELVCEQEVELVVYNTVLSPTLEGAIWLVSEDTTPPSTIYYYDGEATIEYYPEPNELEFDPFDLSQNPDWPYYTCPDCGEEAHVDELHICPVEPNEPAVITVTTITGDPVAANEGIKIIEPNYIEGMVRWEQEKVNSIIVHLDDEVEIYLKNMPLLTKDEVRDFALFMGCMTINTHSTFCDEYYEGLLRLVSEKLLKEPE